MEHSSQNLVDRVAGLCVESTETLDKANRRNRSHLLDLKLCNSIQPIPGIGLDNDVQLDPTDGRGAGKRPA